MTSEKEKPIYFVANLFFMLYIDLSQVGVGGVHSCLLFFIFCGRAHNGGSV